MHLLVLTLILGQNAFATTKTAYMHYMRALLLQHRGEYAQALQEYEAASQLDPRSSYILEQAADLAMETGQLAQALSLAKRLAQADPKSAKARLLTGNIYWAQNDTAKAQQSFEEALKINPKYSEALFALGNLLNTESPEKAKKYLEDYVAQNPERAGEAHYQLAFVEQRQGHADAAIEHLEAAVMLEPDFLQARYSLAHIYEVRHDTDSALAEYLGILEKDKDNVGLLNHIGELYFAKDDSKDAKDFFLKAKAINSRQPESCFWLAILSEQASDFSAAADYLSDSSALKTQAELNLRLSYYLTQSNRLKEAMVVLSEAYKRWPDNNDIAYFLALGYDDVKQYDKAAELLAQVLARDPQSRDARFQLAGLYEKMNKMEDSEREFRKLLESKPNDAAALNYLGYSLTDRGMKLSEAEGLIRRALALDPNNGAYRDSLGWSLFKQGRNAEALEELGKAREKMPLDPTVLDHLGDVENALGKKVEAWVSWKRSDAFQASDTVEKKAAAIEAGFSNGELGDRLMNFLGAMGGPVNRYGGLCEITGKVWSKEFSFNGVFSYRESGDMTLELLGPLFVPMFHVRLSSSGAFAMDRVPIEGISPEVLSSHVDQSFRLIRRYLSGAVFEERPAEYHRGWRTYWIDTPQHQLFLNGSKEEVKNLKDVGEGQSRLSVDEYRWIEGRRVPASLKLEGKGFAFQIRLSEPAVSFR